VSTPADPSAIEWSGPAQRSVGRLPDKITVAVAVAVAVAVVEFVYGAPADNPRAGDEHLTLLDARTGNARWVSTTGVWEIADEVVPGIVVFYPDEWGLVLVDLATGAIVDTADVQWYRIDGRLYALDGTTLRPYDPFGTTTATTASTVDLGSNPGRLLGGSAGRLFLADGTTMRALDTNGATIWTASLPLPSSIAWTRPLDGDRLLVIDDIFDPSGLDAVVVDAATGTVVPGRLPDTLWLDEAVTTPRGSNTYLVGLTDPDPTIDPAGDTSILVAVDTAAPELAVTASLTVPAGAGVRRLGPGEVVVESDFDQLSVLDAATLQPRLIIDTHNADVAYGPDFVVVVTTHTRTTTVAVHR
jgi:hypothetical protein